MLLFLAGATAKDKRVRTGTDGMLQARGGVEAFYGDRTVVNFPNVSTFSLALNGWTTTFIIFIGFSTVPGVVQKGFKWSASVPHACYFKRHANVSTFVRMRAQTYVYTKQIRRRIIYRRVNHRYTESIRTK